MNINDKSEDSLEHQVLSIKNDPLAYLLVIRWKLKLLSFPILLTVLSFVTQILLSFFCSILQLSPKNSYAIFQDRNFWIWCFLLQPSIAIYYLWSIDALENVIKKLNDLDTIKYSDKDRDLMKSLYKKPYRLFISLGVATFATFIFATFHQVISTSWFKDIKLATAVAIINFFIDTYITSMIVMCLFTNIWIIYKIISKANKEQRLNVNPLHPDRCGGLSPLSRYSLNTAYLVAIFGIIISIIESPIIKSSNYKQYWFLHFSIPIYFVISLGCFFGPLIAANKGMTAAKEKLMIEIAKKFHSDYHETHNAFLTSDTELLKSNLIKINQLRSWYKITDEFPIWPFDIKTFQHYLLLVFTSLIPAIVHILDPFLKPMYNLVSHQYK